MKPRIKLLLLCLGLLACLPALALYAPLLSTVGAQVDAAAAQASPSPAAPQRRTTASRSAQTTEDSLWQSLEAPQAEAATTEQARATTSRRLQLNEEMLHRLLASAPPEFSERARQTPLVLTLPLPDGTLARFKVVESAVASPELAAWLPQIKTYQGQGLDDPAMTARFDWSPTGLHGIILAGSKAYFIEPQSPGDTANYLTYDGDAYQQEAGRSACAVNELESATRQRAQTLKPESAARAEATAGTQLRTYRLAVAATGEWTQQYGQGNIATAATAIVSIINQINAIFEKEAAIRFNLINNQGLIYTDAGSDPYENAASGTELDTNQRILDQVVGSANYDIGHVFGGIAVGNGGLSFSGVAGLGVVCTDEQKGRASSTMGGTLTHPINVLGLAHEIGHQFNASHSFNGTTSGCSARSEGSAWEPGSGTTIMSYAGSCDDENLQRGADPYFHIGSLESILNYATTQTCANIIATGNNPPTVNAGQNYTIPKETPFTLTATGNDPDGDAITYSWEQLDLGAAGPPNTDDGQTRPLFRSFAPTTIPSRTFPQMRYVLARELPLTYQENGRTFATGEAFATTTRVMNFHVTARDNRANGGGINSSGMQINVRSEAGPFVVTAPTAGVRLAPGSAQTITWNVAGTDTAPISAANVRLTLSTDGGQTFPQVLAESVPNNGQAQITLPQVPPTATAYIKVEAVGNVFFNVSPVFAIGGECPTLTIEPATLPEAEVFFQYETKTLTTNGGAEPYKYKVTAGALPRGLMLSEAGQLSGVPQEAGTYKFTVTSTDSAQCSGTKEYELKILPEATVADTGVTTEAAPGLTGGARAASTESAGKPVEFVVTLSAPSNERVSVYFATADGTAIAGQNYQANSGTLFFEPGETEKRIIVMVMGATPGGAPTEEFFVNLFDPVNAGLGDKHGACAILEDDSDDCGTITFKTLSLLDARVHENYDQMLQATGGNGIEFELAGGCIPAGLSMDEKGRITGQPLQAGSFKFLVAAIDDEGCFDVREFTLNIGEPAACITGFTPAAGQVGTQVTLFGVRFANVKEVRFGHRPARFAVKSETEIVATVPAEAVTGAISVTTNNGTGTSTQPFTVENTAPVAAPVQLTARRNQTVNGRLKGSDVDGNALRYQLVNLETPPRGKIVLVNPATGDFTYTPPPGYVGEDVFYYRALDGTQGSGIAKVTVSITGAPRITKIAVLSGRGLQRQMIVVGEFFDPDASVLVNGQRLAARNDAVTPDTRLIAFLEPELIRRDAKGMLKVQVRNPDGSLAPEVLFKLPRR
jgi:hypothetical protein